jgi:hypothetical protein
MLVTYRTAEVGVCPALNKATARECHRVSTRIIAVVG